MYEFLATQEDKTFIDRMWIEAARIKATHLFRFSATSQRFTEIVAEYSLHGADKLSDIADLCELTDKQQGALITFGTIQTFEAMNALVRH